jgi:hypothetical protein
MNKSMLLVTSTWGNKKTFRLIPATIEAPYNEAIYDLEVGVLALIGKEKKETLQMVPKLNALGDPEMLKIGKRPGGKDYAESRQTMETYYEYYIETKEEIKELINMIALNSDVFDYNQYLEQKTETPVETKASNLITI